MAGTVYTESVVTLNAAQAESTLNALKSSADELRKKMIEATKLGNKDDAAKYQKELDSVKKSMSNIKKETKDYSDLMKNLNGSSLNELQKAASGLNKQLKNLIPGTKEFIEKSKQLKQVRSRIDEVNASVRGTNKTLDSLKGLLPKLGLATFFAAAAKAVVQFGKDAIAQTQKVGDAWRTFTAGMKSAYNSFVANLSSGKGWKELIANMRESYRVGREVQGMLDDLAERNWSLSVNEAQSRVEIAKLTKEMRDSSKSAEERLRAAERIDTLEEKIAAERISIAQQENKAYKDVLQDRTKMLDDELKEFILDYNKNHDLIKQAQKYNAQVEKLNKNIRATERAGMRGTYTGTLLSDQRSALTDLTESTADDVKKWAGLIAKWDMGNDEMVNNYVSSLTKIYAAQEDYERKTTRSNTTAASLRNELAAKAASQASASYDEALKVVDILKDREDELAKTFAREGEKADEYIRRQIEENAEALEDFTDEDFKRNMEELLDLMDQAADVRNALDPHGALGYAMQQEMNSLEDMYERKLISEEEFQEAKQQLIRQYARENAGIDLDQWSESLEAVKSYFDGAGEAIAALQESRSARLEAQMQKELAAAGENADKRKEIEEKYEAQKLETEKKYAVADMVVNIAKTVAAGALAVMQAFAQLGPIAGAVSAAIMGVTTGAQVATIVAQKNAIMNTTASSSGSSSSIGARVPTGYSSGGYTSTRANDYQAVGIVHANEWVAPAAMVRANPVVFRRLEQARRRGTSVSGVGGFADGGMTTKGMASPESVPMAMDPALVARLTSVLQHIVDNGIPAYVLLSDLNNKQELSASIKQISGKR